MSVRTELLKKAKRRLRRRRHIRNRIFGTPEKPRLSVVRSHQHIYCQLVDDLAGRTLASASTRDKEIRAQLESFGGNCGAAAAVGKAIAERMKAAGVTVAQFDRNGYRFHGRIKALAEAAREAGIKL